jgi:hypothetical protein
VLGLFGSDHRIREDGLRQALAGPSRNYRVWLALAVALLIAAGAIGVQAFTLITGPYLDPVAPQQGVATAPFVVEGGWTYGTCPTSPPTMTFDFYFDKARNGPVIWTTQSSACSNGKVDTGPSPGLLPPPAFAVYGQHTIELDITVNARLLAPQPTQPYTILPSIVLDPTCGSVGDPITVRGDGFQPRLPVGISFEPPPGGKPDASATPGPSGVFAITVPVPNRPAGSYSVVATQQVNSALAVGSLTARAAYLIPCVKGALVLKPTVGPPGTVVMVTGTGFPAGAAVKLAWSDGIKLVAATIIVGASQGFTTEVLIYPHDQLGPRRMSAAPDLAVTKAPIFNIATANFLVVPGTEQPKDFSWRH